MSFTYEARPPRSPFVQTIWRTRSTHDGVHITPADGSWDLIVIKHRTKIKIILGGPMSKATAIPYKKDSEYLGIRFTLGTYMPPLSTKEMLDTIVTLPKKSKHFFWLNGTVWKVPEYENVEILIEQLVAKGILVYDEIVAKTLQGTKPDISLRSVQRRFLQVTGMTLRYLQTIEKARKATELLKKGTPILDVVYELDYADQAHMTRIVKQLTGYTPAKIGEKTTRF